MKNLNLNRRMRQQAWIDRISKDTGYSYSKIAEICSLASTTISRFMNDKDGSGVLSASTEEKISSHFGADIATSSVVEVDKPLAKIGLIRPNVGMASIPEYNVTASAGPGSEVPEMQDPTKSWTVPVATLNGMGLESTNKLAIVTVAGDSMEPEYQAGERVLVDMSCQKITHDGVYIIWNGDGLILKRLQRIGSPDEPMVRVKSTNPDYDDYDVPLKSVLIRGRVAAKWVLK